MSACLPHCPSPSQRSRREDENPWPLIVQSPLVNGLSRGAALRLSWVWAGPARHGTAERLPMVLPSSARSLHGRRCWDLVQARRGREHSICESGSQIVEPAVPCDALGMSEERWFGRSGASLLQPPRMCKGCSLATLCDVVALGKALARQCFLVELIAATGRTQLPLSDGERSCFENAVDCYMLRNGAAVTVNGNLYVQ